MIFKFFDTKTFLKESKYWDAEIKKLQNELDNMPELPSVDNKTGVRSGNISDLTARTAMRRIEIASQIDEYNLYKEMLDFGLKSLAEDERELTNLNTIPKNKRGAFVENYGKKYAMCETYVYEKNIKVLKKMGESIAKEFYGE